MCSSMTQPITFQRYDSAETHTFRKSFYSHKRFSTEQRSETYNRQKKYSKGMINSNDTNKLKNSHTIRIIYKASLSCQFVSTRSKIVMDLTDNLKCNRKAHKGKHRHQEQKENPVVIRTDTICNPRAVMIINHHTGITNLAMPRSFRLHYLWIRESLPDNRNKFGKVCAFAGSGTCPSARFL